MSSPSDRFRQRAARKPVAAPGTAPFASFLERHEERARKSRNKRRMLIVSVAVHVVVFGLLILISAWKVEELFGPSVEVKVMAAESGEGPADGKTKPAPRVNVSRAVGHRLIVTPQGVRTEPRGDLEPAAPALRSGLEGLLKQSLLQKLHYPEAGNDLRLRGTVTVLVDVSDDGQAENVRVKEPCLHPVLCEAGKEAISSVAVWPRAAAATTLAVPIDYRYSENP